MFSKKYLIITALLLTLYWAIPLYTAYSAPLELSTFLFSEIGVFELFSPYLWFILAFTCLISHMTVRTRLASSIMAILLGCREMDLHKMLSSMSFLKIQFYKDTNILFSHKIIGACIILFVAILLIYLSKTFIHSFEENKKTSHPTHYLTILTLALLLISKFTDRLNSQLIDFFNYTLSNSTIIMIQAFEETTEMILPVLLIVAVILFQPKQNH